MSNTDRQAGQEEHYVKKKWHGPEKLFMIRSIPIFFLGARKAGTNKKCFDLI